MRSWVTRPRSVDSFGERSEPAAQRASVVSAGTLNPVVLPVNPAWFIRRVLTVTLNDVFASRTRAIGRDIATGAVGWSCCSVLAVQLFEHCVFAAGRSSVRKA